MGHFFESLDNHGGGLRVQDHDFTQQCRIDWWPSMDENDGEKYGINIQRYIYVMNNNRRSKQLFEALIK